MPVRIEPPGETNLVGYFLRSLVRRALEASGGRLPAGVAGSRTWIRSDGMEVTLAAGPDEVVIFRGRRPRIDAAVRAPLPVLLEVLGGRGVIGATVRGSVGVRGKVWRLLPLLRFLRSGMGPSAEDAP